MDNEKKIYNNLIVSSAPHMVSDTDATKLMGTVILALMPAFFAGVYVFGTRVILLTLVCIISSIIFEWLYNILTHKTQTVGDLSAALTGLLIALNVPSSLPIWMGIFGSFVAIVVVKQLFGGIGRNFANPAITARIVLAVSFASEMTTWPLPRMSESADAVTGATPLSIAAAGDYSQLPSNTEMFLGFIGGCVGEVSALALLIGGLFLIWRKVISPLIPAAFIGTVFVLAWLITGSLNLAVFNILAGGVMLGAFFMATDYVTSPKLPSGKILFGVGCGIITIAIRFWGSYPEGVSFSILLMNMVSPLLNRYSYKGLLGGAKNEK